jgi:hypothetical protein
MVHKLRDCVNAKTLRADTQTVIDRIEMPAIARKFVKLHHPKY